MSESPTAPEPDPDAPHGSADPPVPAPDGSAEPSDQPAARPPLRPVDWDGSFTRTWASRDRDAIMNRLAAEHEAEWEQREQDQWWREYVDRSNAAAGESARVEPDATDSSAGAGRSLFDRLENFGRPAHDEDDEDGPAASE